MRREPGPSGSPPVDHRGRLRAPAAIGPTQDEKANLGFETGLPVVLIDTEPGDLTLHLSCTLHRTFPPESGERYVVYTTFSLADSSDRAVTDPAYAKVASMGR